MSEKRFVLCKKGDVEYIEDNCCVQLYGFDVLCEMLNEQQGIIEEKSNVIILMGAFIKSKGFSIDDFDEWISKDWHNVGDDL